MQCDYCFLASSQKCDKNKVFKDQLKCGENKYDIYMGFFPETGVNYMNSTLEEVILSGQIINNSNFELNMCIFNAHMDGMVIEKSNFTEKVSFYNTNFNTAQIKHTIFSDQVYFKQTDFT